MTGTDQPQRSAWDFFRRRVAPVLMLVVLGLLAARTCRSEATKVAVVVDLGDGRSRARRLQVEYFRGDDPDPVAHMRLEYGAGGAPGPARQQLQLDRGSYRAVIEVTTEDGVQRFERRLRVGDQDTIRIAVDLDNP